MGIKAVLKSLCPCGGSAAAVLSPPRPPRSATPATHVVATPQATMVALPPALPPPSTPVCWSLDAWQHPIASSAPVTCRRRALPLQVIVTPASLPLGGEVRDL